MSVFGCIQSKPLVFFLVVCVALSSIIIRSRKLHSLSFDRTTARGLPRPWMACMYKGDGAAPSVLVPNLTLSLHVCRPFSGDMAMADIAALSRRICFFCGEFLRPLARRLQ